MRLYDSWVRLTLVATLAEGEEGGVGVVEGGFAAFTPPALPFPFKEIHVIAWCDEPGVMVGFGVQLWKIGAATEQGSL